MGVHLACGRVRVRLTEGAFLAGGGRGQEFRRPAQEPAAGAPVPDIHPP